MIHKIILTSLIVALSFNAFADDVEPMPIGPEILPAELVAPMPQGTPEMPMPEPDTLIAELAAPVLTLTEEQTSCVNASGCPIAEGLLNIDVFNPDMPVRPDLTEEQQESVRCIKQALDVCGEEAPEVPDQMAEQEPEPVPEIIPEPIQEPAE